MAEPATAGSVPTALAEDHAEAPGALAVIEAFVNTYDTETDADVLVTPAALDDWLRARGLLQADRAPDAADLRRAVAVREALRALLRANHDGQEPPDVVTGLLEREADSAPLGLAFAGGHASLRPTGTGIAEAIGRLMAIVFHAMHDGTWERLKVCGSDTCAVAFWDSSRNRSGRWCSMAVCGNRAKVAAYRDRHGSA